MTPATLSAWIEALRISKSEASRRIGISRTTLDTYLDGTYPIPLTVALACAAVRYGLDPEP